MITIIILTCGYRWLRVEILRVLHPDLRHTYFTERNGPEGTIFIPYFMERNEENLYIKYSLNHSRGIQMSLNATKTLVIDLD